MGDVTGMVLLPPVLQLLIDLLRERRRTVVGPSVRQRPFLGVVALPPVGHRQARLRVDQFGTSGCVGYGRCITWCPPAIEITAEIGASRSGEG